MRYYADSPLPDADAERPYEEGLPLPEPPAGPPSKAPGGGKNVVPHYLTFSQVVNYASRTYRWQFDEALKHRQQNALAIRRDPVVMDALRSRQMPTAQLPWHIESPNDQDTKQQEAVSLLTEIIEQIPRFQQLVMQLLEAVFYGRYASQINYGWDFSTGKRRLVVRDHKPINGDKLVFKYSGQVGILVHMMADVTWQLTDRGRAHMFTPAEREQLIIHRHEPEDADFYEGEMAGAIGGVGVRSRLYWLWYLKSQVTAFLMDYLERVGAGGFTIYYYEMGNQTSLAEVKDAAEKQWRNNAILFPRYRDNSTGGPGIQRVEPSLAGAQLLQTLVTQYFDAIIRRYILGQELTSEAGPTGLGSGLADLHGETFSRIIKYDAVNLAETLTTDLLWVLQKYNTPGLPPLRFKFDVDKPNAREVLEAATAFYQMGGTIDESELRSVIGLAKPAAGHAMLAKMGPMSPAAAGAIPQNVPFLGQPGPEGAAGGQAPMDPAMLNGGGAMPPGGMM